MNDMTRDEILNMPAGKEMDALIANVLMSWNGLMPDEAEVAIRHEMMQSYSTDISAAWEVVEKIKSNHWRFYFRGIGTYYAVEFQRGAANGETTDWTDADTAPLAICRAALLAVMAK